MRNIEKWDRTMDKQELINKFIKENLELFLTENYDKHLCKLTKKKFFIDKHHAKKGVIFCQI